MSASEAELQRAVTSHLLDREARARDLMFVHIPNEGKRSRKTGRELRRQGYFEHISKMIQTACSRWDLLSATGLIARCLN